MKKLLLTSSGFENARIAQIFFELCGKEPGQIRVLFIPAAANDVDAIMVLPACMNDLLQYGIPKENIAVFDLHRAMPYEELSRYDALYFTGGSPSYLLGRILDTGFDGALGRFVESGGVYVGVSAGSLVATDSLPGGLGYVRCTMGVHRAVGTEEGDLVEGSHVDLTASRLLLVSGSRSRVMETGR